MVYSSIKFYDLKNKAHSGPCDHKVTGINFEKSGLLKGSNKWNNYGTSTGNQTKPINGNLLLSSCTLISV